jgi:hypothetical protein
MIHHDVDPNDRRIDSDDLACWLLFYLESHGASVTLTARQEVHVNLDPMPGLTAAVVDRWAPVIAKLLPEFREILLARPNQRSGVPH